MKRFFCVVSFLLVMSCSVAPVPDKKINGISFVASRIAIDSSHIAPVLKLYANAASVMPFGFIRDASDPKIRYNSDRQWFGETVGGAKQYVETLHENGISVMLKPQIWIGRGQFTGHLVMQSDEEWLILENSYENFIMDYAVLAETANVDIFCIGTELEMFVKNRPLFWNKLIDKIRAVYKGKLTYAANWDEFWRTPFWDSLDYIGIDAYFPISDSKTPTVDECIKGWEPHKQNLKKFSEQWNKPVLFAEFGYRSVDYTTKEPWRYDRSMTQVNLDAQNNATKALFESIWNEPWFAGGYLWKWFVNHDKVGGYDNSQFTPQNKPVEEIIRTHYSNYR